MRNLPRKHRTIMTLCILLLVSIIGMSFSSPSQEGTQAATKQALSDNVNQYLGKWKGTFVQGERSGYPMVLTISRKETNEITAAIEWPSYCTTRGGGFAVTQQEEGRFASKCISWTELDYIEKNKGGVVLHGRYIANLVNDNELKGIYILAHNLKQGGTFSLSKIED